MCLLVHISIKGTRLFAGHHHFSTIGKQPYTDAGFTYICITNMPF